MRNPWNLDSGPFGYVLLRKHLGFTFLQEFSYFTRVSCGAFCYQCWALAGCGGHLLLWPLLSFSSGEPEYDISFDKMLPSVSLDSFWGTYVGWIFDLLELCSKFPTFLFLFFISVFFFYFWWDFQFYLLFCFLLFLKSCFPYLGWFSFQHLSLLMTKALPKMYKLCVSGLGLKGPHFRVMG